MKSFSRFVDCIDFFVYLKCCNGATTKQNTTTMTQFRIETPTKTFGKETKKMLKEVFPTCVQMKFHGSKMNGMVNFYDADGNHIGYWSNWYSDKGFFRNF